nr:MAG TPA: hypothetical protein [Caudoviricetes sp.]
MNQRKEPLPFGAAALFFVFHNTPERQIMRIFVFREKINRNIEF